MDIKSLGVAIMLRRNGKIAFCKRLAENRSYCGKWALVGGGVDVTELHNPLIAAIRETEEEAGVKLYPYQIEYFDAAVYQDPEFICLYYLADLHPNQKVENKEPHKHSDWEFLTPAEAIQRDLIPCIPGMLAKLNA